MSRRGKPVSLQPLKFRDALRALLRVRPEKETESETEVDREGTAEQPGGDEKEPED